jgi:hypothetical protein
VLFELLQDLFAMRWGCFEEEYNGEWGYEPVVARIRIAEDGWEVE